MDLLTIGIVLVATAVIFYGHDFIRSRKRLHIKSLEGKHVFITGASSGIGLALARKALQEGAYVTLTGRTSSTLKNAVVSLSKDVTDSAHRIQMKVADVGDYKVMSDTLHESFAWKPIDVLICNAGLTRPGYLDQLAVEDMDLIVRTNILGVIYPIHAILPLMKTRSPSHPMSIILMGSLASLFLMYGNSVYTGTKYALKGIAESLRLELLPYSIRISLVCPGFVATPFLNDAEKADGALRSLMKDINMYDRKQAHSSEEVAAHTMQVVKSGSPIVAMTPVLGSTLVLLGRGFMPGDSILTTFHEILAYPVLRIFTLFAQFDMHRKILNSHRKHHKNGIVQYDSPAKQVKENGLST